MKSEAVRAYRTEIVIPTYPYGPADPNPPFPDGRWVDIYPYPMLTDLGESREERSYTALILENRYLRLTVLPELGGHLYSAFDKVGGHEIFYRNNVVKPGLVALRGAWISGGIEFNFPIGHSVTTVSPVDWHLEARPDGATIWVGDLERVSRMQWWVGITLRPDRARFETQVVVYNRTPVRHRYYFWSNSAVRATDGLQFICPTDYRKVGGHIGPYPVDGGKDLSWYRNHDHAVDVFAHESRENWFGWYDHGEDAGLVHVANAPECLGKKMFTWGTADDGLIWADILSDGDGPYCEVQSGRFEDQSTWRFLEPRHVESWREYWYPVAGAGPFVAANEDLALALRRERDALCAGVYANREMEGMVLEAYAGDALLLREPAVAGPGSPFRVRLAGGVAEAEVRLRVLDAQGRVLLSYRPRPEPGPVPAAPPPPPDTAETRVLAGVRAEQAYRMEEAARHYRSALELDPECAAAHRGLGVVALWRGQPEEAAQHFEAALRRAADDAEARYYLGCAAWLMGDEASARFHLGQAARTAAFGAAARALLDEIAAACRDEEGVRFVLARPQADARARTLASAAWRRMTGTCDAGALRAGAGPASALELRERYLCGRVLAAKDPRALEDAVGHRDVDALRREWQERVRREPEAYLEVAHDYAGARLLEDAIEVLVEGVADASAPGPMMSYTVGWLLEQAGREGEAAAWFRRGREGSPVHCFPHRADSIAVLKRAIARDPEDGRARLYLGTLLYARGRREEAVMLWDEAISLEPQNAVLRRNRGWAAWRSGDLERAAAEYDAALAADPEEFHRYIERDEVAAARREAPAARLARLEGAPPGVSGRSEIVARRAALHILMEEFETAARLIATRRFHPWEGALGMRRIYLDAHVGRGLERLAAGHAEGALSAFKEALEYPRNVAVGRPARPADAEPACLAGCAAALAGRQAEAAALWEQAALEAHARVSDLWCWQTLALRRLGRADEGRERLAQVVEHARAELGKSPEAAGAHYLLGLAMAVLGEEGEARQALGAALQRDPNHWRARLLASEAVWRAAFA